MYNELGVKNVFNVLIYEYLEFFKKVLNKCDNNKNYIIKYTKILCDILQIANCDLSNWRFLIKLIKLLFYINNIKCININLATEE